MKNIFLLLMCFLLITLSCTDTGITPTAQVSYFPLLDFKISSDHDGEQAPINISIISNGQAFTDEISTIEVLAQFRKLNDIPVDPDSVIVGGYPISKVEGTGNFRKVFGFDPRADIVDGIALYGDQINFEVRGDNDIPSFNISKYLPQIVNFYTYDHGGKIDLTSDLTVTWNSDEGNSTVNVGIFYIPRGSDTELPVHEVYTTPDDGSFTIPSEDLGKFPVGYEVTVGIARGFIIDEDLGTSGYFARLGGITYSISEEIITTTQ